MEKILQWQVSFFVQTLRKIGNEYEVLNLVTIDKSRGVVLISLAILIQLIALVSVVLKFNDYFVFFYWACLIISMIAVFLILNGKTILLFPIFLSRRERRKLKSIGMKVENALVLQPEVLSEIMLHDDGAGQGIFKM